MAHITDFLRIRGSSHTHTGHLDIGVVGSSVEALLCASSISQLDIVTVKVFSFGNEEDVAYSPLELDVGSLNAINAISPQLCRALTSAGEPLPPSTNTSRISTRKSAIACNVAIRGAPLPHTPAARGIRAGARVQQAALTDLISAALPRGMLQPEMHFVGVKEEVNGVKLSFQAGEPVQAKLLVVCGSAASSVSATVGQGQPWGRGRIAVIPKAADGQVNVEAAVELAYSLSEHGLTPAAFRAFAMSMARSQDAQQDGLQQRAFPPVAQPEALKGSATSSMGSSPCGSLKMQELRPFEARGLQNSAA